MKSFMKPSAYLGGALLSCLLWSCNTLEPEGGPALLEGVQIADEGNGIYTVTVNATDKESWVYFNLADRTQVASPAEPTRDSTWDLGFRRFFIKSNGGVSGAAQVQVSPILNASFEELDAAPSAPEGGWLQDRSKSQMSPDAPPDVVVSDDVDYAFNQSTSLSESGWYNYQPDDHTLSPAAVVYVVQTRGRYFKIQLLNYYDGAGTPAVVSFRMAEIGAAQALVVDTNEGVYLNLRGETVSVSAPDSSMDWDVAIRRTSMRTNSQTSGPGLGGAMWAQEAQAFGSIETVSTIGFQGDEELPNPGPPGAGTSSQNPVLVDWYHYDVSDHSVTPKARVLLLRSADGSSYAKLQILSYADGVFELAMEPVEARALPQQMTVEAVDSEVWVHLNLRTGIVVEPETPENSLGWDIAFSRTMIRLNGGTSGVGESAAVEAGSGALDALTAVPSQGMESDQMLPLPGPPGSGEFSGNPSLNRWFDYDPVSHSLSVRDVNFVIRTAVGDFAKLKILGYDDGIFRLNWAYAGPQKEMF